MTTTKNKQQAMPQQWDCPHASCDGFLQLYGDPGDDGKLVAKSVFCSRDKSQEKPCPLRLMFSRYLGTCKACNVDMKLVSFTCMAKTRYDALQTADPYLQAS